VFTITATTYFSNNIMIKNRLPLARAVTLMNHSRAIIPPEAGLVEVRGVNYVLLVPDQIIFNLNRAFVPRVPQPTKRGVWERDGGVCAYCGKSIPLAAATLDHINPQWLDGRTAWDNLVTSCIRCNQRKGGRTPDQAHMRLLYQPSIPKVRLRPE
jgi:hypothetical protein